MTEEEFAKFEEYSTAKLLEFITEKDSSQRKHAAELILSLRRIKPSTDAAVASAKYAKYAAIASFISVGLSVLMMFFFRRG